jgi:hypothetical protein
VVAVVFLILFVLKKCFKKNILGSTNKIICKDGGKHMGGDGRRMGAIPLHLQEGNEEEARLPGVA